MATIVDQGFPNLANILARLGPDGQIRPIAELLNKKLDFIDDIPWVECNLETGQQISLRTGLPSPQWRSINQGVSLTKTDVATYIESTGMIEDRAEVDVDAPGDMAGLRLSEEAGKIEMMTQEFARALFYESTYDNADRIHGLTPRYGGTTGFTASGYVLKPGTNAGVNARSIWLVNWEPGKVYGVYPKRSTAGLVRKDLGEIDCFDSANKKFRGYATKLQWKCGIAVEDYRANCRFQWDPDDTTNFADTAKAMYLTMQTMLGTVFLLGANARFYMDRTSFNKLCAQLASNSVNFLEYVAMGGRRIPSFLGVPIRITDALVAETAIA
jgi:hypothetical protein